MEFGAELGIGSDIEIDIGSDIAPILLNIFGFRKIEESQIIFKVSKHIE